MWVLRDSRRLSGQHARWQEFTEPRSAWESVCWRSGTLETLGGRASRLRRLAKTEAFRGKVKKNLLAPTKSCDVMDV